MAKRVIAPQKRKPARKRPPSPQPPLPNGKVVPRSDMRDSLARMSAPQALDKEENRKRWRLEELAYGRGPYLVELNVQHRGGLPAAARDFLALFAEVCVRLSKADGISAPPAPLLISKSYFRCEMRVKEWRALIAEDEQRASKADKRGALSWSRCIYRLWPDFPVESHITRSVSTVKADAALRSFEATGEEITWAVIDSGVDATHAHFGRDDDEHGLLHPTVRDLHRCFATLEEPARPGGLPIPAALDSPDAAQGVPNRDELVAKHRAFALRDEYGHGTHVAGIITGRAPRKNGQRPKHSAEVVILEREYRIDAQHMDDDARAHVKATRPRKLVAQEIERTHGVAPGCRLVSLRVLDEKGQGRSSDVIRALEYVRETLNDNPKHLRVHGVNLSVGYEFDAEMFACGQSPICHEVNRLVLAGVVVVTAAGNTGYGTVSASVRTTTIGLSNTINDPGNAEHAITVGSTHRDSPHTYGVSYFSSKGPTGDGRMKPDLVAPGERIVSCAAGAKLSDALSRIPANGKKGNGRASPTYYVEESGTSMAAPHVSGAIAAFLSIRREFIGRPLDVKRIFLGAAVPLGRERYFEGHGLLDLMKAIQSV